MKKTRIKKMGNSHGIIIPKDILAKANITDHVLLTTDNDKIIISPDHHVGINEAMRHVLTARGVSILDNNTISFNGLEIALNDEQIYNLNNQYGNE